MKLENVRKEQMTRLFEKSVAKKAIKMTLLTKALILFGNKSTKDEVVWHKIILSLDLNGIPSKSIKQVKKCHPQEK